MPIISFNFSKQHWKNLLLTVFSYSVHQAHYIETDKLSGWRLWDPFHTSITIVSWIPKPRCAASRWSPLFLVSQSVACSSCWYRQVGECAGRPYQRPDHACSLWLTQFTSQNFHSGGPIGVLLIGTRTGLFQGSFAYRSVVCASRQCSPPGMLVQTCIKWLVS